MHYPNLKYIECEMLTIDGEIVCPNLEGVYVTSNIRINPGAALHALERHPGGRVMDTGIRTKISCVKLDIFCDPAVKPTQVNWCEFYTEQFTLTYGDRGGFISNSAYYLGLNPAGSFNVHFYGTPNTAPEYVEVLPQFYFSANCNFNVANYTGSPTSLVGCFFMSEDWNGTLFVGQQPGQLGDGHMHGVFVGNYDSPDGNPEHSDNVFDTITWGDWEDMIWDEDIKDMFSGAGGARGKAVISDIEIIGTAGVELEYAYDIEVDVTGVRLKDMEDLPDDFEDRALIWNAPEGLNAVMYYDSFIDPAAAEETTITLTVSGVPAWATNEEIDILIPGIMIDTANGKDIDSTPNEYAVWNISGVTGSYEEIRVATSSVTGGITGKGADLRDITGD
jgi:hypothetical protein